MAEMHESPNIYDLPDDLANALIAPVLDELPYRMANDLVQEEVVQAQINNLYEAGYFISTPLDLPVNEPAEEVEATAVETPTTQPPSIGRIVIYVDTVGGLWPAIVTRCQGEVADLHVFTNTPSLKAAVRNDEIPPPDKTGVGERSTYKRHSWHWPIRQEV